MKTIKLLFTVLAVVAVIAATAVERPQMNVVPLSGDRAVVSIQNEEATNFELSIYAQDGELVYYKQTAEPSSAYQKVFDFADLENGNYTMDLRVNDTRLLKELEVASKGIFVGESKLRIDPYFAFAGDVLKLTYLNFDQESLNLSIYDENGLVYESGLGRGFNVAAGYDLSALKEGEYEVALTSMNNDFSFSLEK